MSTWLARLDMTAYLVLFYLCLAIVCLVILDVFYVSYSFSKKKFAFVWPMQALRSVCGLFVTVLYLPFLGKLCFCFAELERYESFMFKCNKCQ